MEAGAEQGSEAVEVAKTAVLARHPRYSDLVTLYSTVLTASGAAGGSGALAAEMLTISLRSMAANSIEKEPVSKRVPASLNIGKLKLLCKRMFDLEPEVQILYFETGDKVSGMVPNMLDDDDASLGFFGVPDGATIYMNELDVRQKEREAEAWAQEQQRREQE